MSVEADQEHSSHVKAITSATVSGAVAGTVLANTAFRPDAEFIPGNIESDVSLGLGGQGADVTYGSTLHLPNAPSIVEGTHLNFDITRFNDAHSFSRLTSLFSEYDSSIATPVKHALGERLLNGMTLGALAAGTITYLALRKGKPVEDGAIKPSLKETIKSSSIGKIALTVAIGATLLLNAYSIAHETVGDIQRAGLADEAEPLRTELTSQDKLLEGASAEGLMSDFANLSVSGAVAYKHNVDEIVTKSTANFDKAFEKYQTAGKSKWFGNPNYKVSMHISDTHCNYLMYKHGVRPVAGAFKPEVTFVSGDTYSNAGTMPYEKNCFTSLRSAIAGGDKESLIVYTIGNHDPKKTIAINDYPKVVTPNEYNNYTVKTPVGTVVSTPDTSRTTWHSSPPEETDEMYKLIAKQGAQTAKVACKVADQTGELPIVMTHRPQASFKTSMLGCASLILKGHTHDRQKVQLVPSLEDNAVLTHTAGSASGAHNTFQLYEPPRKPATYTMFFSNENRQIVGSTTVTFEPNSEVTIEDEKIPTEAKSRQGELYTAQQEFLEQYDSK